MGPRRSTGGSTSSSTGIRPVVATCGTNCGVSVGIPRTGRTITSNPRSRKRRTSAPVILNGGNGATSMSQRGHEPSQGAIGTFVRRLPATGGRSILPLRFRETSHSRERAGH